jgi:cytochrome P450
MRADAPVLFLEQHAVHLVTRHDLVTEVLRDPQTYSSRFGAISMPLSADEGARMVAVFAEGYRRVPTMLTADVPAHTRYRRLVAKAFHPQSIAALEPVIRRVADRLLDRRRTDRVRA